MQIASVDRRILILILGFWLLWALLTARLFFIQIVDHPRMMQLALRQQERTIEIQPSRGTIYDRNGQPLAMNRKFISFYVVPNELQQPLATAQKLAKCLGISAVGLEHRFKSSRAFVWVKRKVTDEAAQQVLALNLPGVHKLEESKRVYPEGKLACHVLGFVGLDNQGLAGVEQQFDHEIQGQSGWIRVNQDAQGQNVLSGTRIFKQSQPGQDVYLTLDKVVQHFTERELEAGVLSNHAKAGSAVVLDARTGEILALANYPDFDPNLYSQYPAAVRKNRAVSDSYEPGSTFKVITAAAALEEGICRENEIIDCEQGHAVLNGLNVRDHEPRGRISFRDVIIYSSNIGSAKVGIRLGSEKLYHYVQAFGIGKATGVELPGETDGILKPLNEWRRWGITAIPYGQGVAASTLQMAAVYTAVINAGKLMQPWILLNMKGPDNIITQAGAPHVRNQVISAATAERVRTILEDVVQRGTGVEAKLDPYRVAGKTGTAQKSIGNGRGYDPTNHVASFIGFFPADNPRFLVSVVIDAPQVISWGGLVAGPVFRKIGTQLIAYAGIPPMPQKVYALAPKLSASQAAALAGPEVTIPDMKGIKTEAAKSQLKSLGLQVICLGAGDRVLEQRPNPGARLDNTLSVVLYMMNEPTRLESEKLLQQVPVPSVVGRTVREALRILNAYELRADIAGTGVVATQEPKPKMVMEAGEFCSLQCQDPEGLP